MSSDPSRSRDCGVSPQRPDSTDRSAEIQQVFDMLGLSTEQERQAKQFTTLCRDQSHRGARLKFTPQLSNVSNVLEIGDY